MDAFMISMKQASYHLAMIKEPIRDADLVLYVLYGLNLGFHDLVIGILLISDITHIDELHHLLLLHE